MWSFGSQLMGDMMSKNVPKDGGEVIDQSRV